MQIRVRGLKHVKGALTRKMVAEMVTDYADRHPRVKRLDTVTIEFMPDVRYDGQSWGGIQQGPKIKVSTHNRRQRRLNVYVIVHILFHELHHMSIHGASNAVGTKGPLGKHEPSEWQEEIDATMAASAELTNWAARMCHKNAMLELKEIAPYAKQWPKFK